MGGVRPLHISHLIAPDHRVDVPCARFNILEKETGGGVGLPGKTVERGGQHPAAHGGVGRKGGVGGAGHDPAVRDLVHRHSVPSVGGDVIVDSSTDRKDQQRENKQKGQEAFHRQVSFLKKAAALRGGLSGTLERSRTSGLPLRRRSLYPTELQGHGTWVFYHRYTVCARRKEEKSKIPCLALDSPSKMRYTILAVWTISSAGMSIRLTCGRSQVQVLYRPPDKALRHLPRGFFVLASRSA